MRTIDPLTSAAARRHGFYRRTCWLTSAVAAGTLAVSVAALASSKLMGVLVRNLTQLQEGQWWRVLSPVLVQPDGWGQLAFNLLGVVVVGAALERRTSRPSWALTYLLGGVGSIMIISAWHPPDPGGGSSDAVAALIGAYTVLLAVTHHDDPRHHHPDIGTGRRVDTLAQFYCVFFAGYLTALDLGGVWPSILAGDATIIAYAITRRAISSTTLSQGRLLFVVAAGVVMTIEQDGHGTGLLVGAAVGILILFSRHFRDSRVTRRST